MSRIRIIFLLAVAGIVSAVSLIATASSTEAVAPLDFRSCYNNEFPILPGAFKAAALGSGSGDGEIELVGQEEREVEGNAVTWAFSATVTGNKGAPFTNSPGRMRGALSITVLWSDKSLGITQFVANCIAEVSIEGNNIEAELEGWVVGFPGKSAPKHAVASFAWNREGDHHTFLVSVELGSTCFENTDEFGISGDASDLSLGGASSPMNAGRASIPEQFTPSSNPCPDVYF